MRWAFFLYQTSMYSHVYEKRFNRVFKVSSFNNSGTWTINLKIFFTSSDSNLYNSIATAIDPDASCIANLLTHMSSKGSEKVQDINIFSISWKIRLFSQSITVGNSQKIRLDTAWKMIRRKNYRRARWRNRSQPQVVSLKEIPSST